MPPRNIVIGQKIARAKVERALELRREMTPAERILWDALRKNRLDGWHMRRQQIICGFIVDFYCHQAGLVIEVDGPVHDRQTEDDAARDQALQAAGMTVLRFTNRQVTDDLPAVLAAIRAALGSGERTEPPRPRTEPPGPDLTPRPPSRRGKGESCHIAGRLATNGSPTNDK